MLRLHVRPNLVLAPLVRRHFVGLVLAQHLLKVLLLLPALLLLELAFHFHLFFQAVDEVDILAEGLLVFVALSGLLFAELAIATLLLLHDLAPLGLKLFALALAEQLHMLVLKHLIPTTLAHLVVLSLLLLIHLLVEFASDQATALLLPHHRLLLLLVMQQRVELLDRGPFVLLRELRVDLCASVGLARCEAHAVSVVDLSAPGPNAHRLRTVPRATHRPDRLGIGCDASLRSSLRRRSSRAYGWCVRFAILENSPLLVAKIGLFANLGVEVAQIVLGQSTVFEEASDLVVNVRVQRWLVAVL